MSSEQIKSLIRHILTGLGILFTVIGLDKWIPMIQYIQDNLETTSIAIMTLVGVVSTIVGFFKDKKRWQKLDDQKNTQ